MIAENDRLQEVLEGKGENYILPFLWLHGKGEEIIREYIQKIFDTGIRAVCLESRPHPEFVREGWWKDVSVVLQEAKERGMKVWILDDSHFPTGFANGRVRQAEDKLKRKFLVHREFDVEGPLKDYHIRIDLENGLAEKGKPLSKHTSRLMACLMSERGKGKFWSGTAADITDQYSDGWLTFDVPEGKYRISYILEQTGGVTVQEDYINMLDQNSVKLLIDEVYESHYSHLKEYFGNTLAGFFSDEPGFYNLTAQTGFSMDMKIGTEMPLPWDEKVDSLLEERLGKQMRRNLPYLWFEGGVEAQEIRYHYMDIVTDLYQENFSDYIGTWCEEHGVQYIGHIIEDNNTHARLGPSCGHYFKAIHGQHMSGVDVVQHQIMPELNGAYYSFTLNKEADGAFYYYGLAKLGASMAHLEKKTRGRALCELYGAYGWMEGLRLMKWLTDHMLVRGINTFVPHAFSDMNFPDPDCPPHFYADGNDPQYPYMKYLFQYLNRSCHLLNGGKAIVHAAVLYHAELEWMGDCMMFHQIGKELMENQTDYDVVPIEKLFSMEIKDGGLYGDGVSYHCLFVPGAQKYPEALKEWLKEAKGSGLPVYQVTEEQLEQEEIAAKIIPLDRVSQTAVFHKCNDIEILKKIPYLRYYHYIHEKDNSGVHMFFNESTLHEVHAEIRLHRIKKSHIYTYDPYENRLSKRLDWQDGTILLHLEPAETLYLIESDESYEAETAENIIWKDEKTGFEFEISAADYRSPEQIDHVVTTSELQDFFQWRPEFAGSIYYKTQIGKQETPCMLHLGAAYETAEVFVNGKSAGVRINTPYRFDLTGMPDLEENEIIIKIATNLVYAQCDRFSRNAVIAPMGLMGPVTLLAGEKPQAFNPYLPSYEYIPDGEPHIFGDRVYIYGSHDSFDGDLYCMNDYVCYSAAVTDLTAWRYEGVIYRKNQDPRNTDRSHCIWAPDVVKGLDGRYYLYYCMDVLPEIGVAVCDTPAGNYEYLGLVRYSNGEILGRREGDYIQFDPGVFIDTDKSIYLYSGNAPRRMEDVKQTEKKSSQVMKLKEDMLTIEEGPVPLIPSILNSAGTGYEGYEFFEASSVRKIGERYYFVYSDVNSSSLCYAVSDHPDSGYEFGGVLIDICDNGIKGRNYKANFSGNTHGGIEYINGKWYLFYHRQTNHTQFSRQGCAEEIKILPDGTIPQVEITSCGLNGGPLRGKGLYEARIACNLWGKNGVAVLRKKDPESEFPYFTQDGPDREDTPNQYIANMRDGAVCGFKYFLFSGVKEITIGVRGKSDGKFLITTEPGGNVCGEILVKPECGDSKEWVNFTGNVKIPHGVHGLFFEYKGKGSVDFLDFELK